MSLNKARILSSENDASVKQEQNTNINIKVAPTESMRTHAAPSKLNVPIANGNIQYPKLNSVGCESTQYPEVQPVNFTGTQNASAYPFQQQTNNTQERGISEIGSELETLDKKNKFLEMLIEMYEQNPLRVNSYIVVRNELLMDMIKLLTECDKVELVLDDDIGCSGCTNDKFIYLSKILITKNNKTEEFKYAYNDIYSQFIKYGISLKVTV